MAVFASRVGQVPERVNYVPYIQSSGIQYIDTLFKPKYNTRVVLDVSDVTSVDTMIFGAKNADSATASAQFAIYRRDSTSVRSDYFGTNAVANISDTTTRTVIDKNGATVTMWGQTIQNTAVSTGEVPYTMYLFSANAGGKVSTYCKAKIYSCRIYDNGVLVRDLWPCYDPDGVACMYDRAQKKYRYNQGSGEFYTEDRLPPKYYWQKHTVAEDPVYKEESMTSSIGANVYYCNNKMAVKRTDGGALVWDLPNAIPRAEYTGGAYTTYPYFYNKEQNSNVLYYATMLYYGSPYTQNKYTLTGVKEIKGSYIYDVASNDPNAYPENGVQDGYWYVKVS